MRAIRGYSSAVRGAVHPGPERRSYVADKAEQRKQIRAKIAKLAKDRDAYVAAENAKPEKADSFDNQVFSSIRAQAAEKGISY